MTNRRVAYGETKAPADVDTLRDESCPICSESDAFDGDECTVCGYVAPPKPFRDPDTDVARTLDLRKQVDEAQGDFGGTNTGFVDPNNPLPDSEQAAQMEDEEPVAPSQIDEDGRVPVDVRALDADGAPVAQTPVPVEDGEIVEEEPIAPEELPDEEGQEAAEDAQADAEGSALVCPVCGLSVPSAAPLTIGDAPSAPTNDANGLTEGSVCPNCGQGVLIQQAQLISATAQNQPRKKIRTVRPRRPDVANARDNREAEHFGLENFIEPHDSDLDRYRRRHNLTEDVSMPKQSSQDRAFSTRPGGPSFMHHDPNCRICNMKA